MILFSKKTSQDFSGIYLVGEVKIPNFTFVKRVAGSHLCYCDFPEEIDREQLEIIKEKILW